MAAQMWNVMRIGRIICNAILKFAALQQHDQKAYIPGCSPGTESSHIVYQMQMDILASVPQYLDMIGEQSAVRLSQHPEHSFGQRLPEAPAAVWKAAKMELSDLPFLRIARGHQLLWSVGLVGRSVDVAHPIRKAACRILRLAGEALGMSQAFAYADTLEKDRMISGGSCNLL